MTTYTFYKNCITVSFGDSNKVIFSDTQMRHVLAHLQLDFIEYYCSLPGSDGGQYFAFSEMIEKLQIILGKYDNQFVIDMLRQLILVVNCFNYPKFRIIFNQDD